MGYTHYWTQTRDFTPEEMGDIGASVRRIINTVSGQVIVGNYDDAEARPLVICGGDGTGEPEISKTRIWLNGDGEHNLDHETFWVDAVRDTSSPRASEGWGFCKTAQKPYDIVVTAILTLLCASYDYQIGSDGDLDDWDAGVKLAEEALGRQFANPLIVEAMTA